MKTIELIQGPRFYWPPEKTRWPPKWIRGASRSIVAEVLPASGPITREKAENGKFYAKCWGIDCHQTSKQYARKNENAMYSWAHNHRCHLEKGEMLKVRVACSKRLRQYTEKNSVYQLAD